MEAKREYMCKERIVDLEFKVSRLGLLGKAYYDLVQIKLKRHRTQIATARTQNMLLHAALDTLRHKATIARKNLGDLESLRKTVTSLRITYDHQRKLVFSRQNKLEAQVTDTHSAELECAGVLDPNTPDLIRIRQLEALLNAMRLKTKDVQTLMRHYEATLKPMKDDYFAFAAKLDAAQNVLNMKNAECEKLVNSHHDAIRARDASKKELEELIGQLFGKDGRDMAPPEIQNKILAAIKEIKEVMEVGSMREMYHQFILQEKQSAYLESIYTELKRTVDQLKNDYPPTRKKSIQPHAVHSMIEGTKNMVRRHSSRRGSMPLLQILEGTQKLVERLHEGNLTMPAEEGETKEVLAACQERMSKLVQALHRKMKHVNREAHKRAKDDARAAGREYVRESRFAELDAEEDARKAAKEKMKAEVRREMEEREAEARRREEERAAAREKRRAEIREEMEEFRAKSKKQAEEHSEAFALWEKEHGPTRASTSVNPTEKSVKFEAHIGGPSGHTEVGVSSAEPAQEGPESPSPTHGSTEAITPVTQTTEAAEVAAPPSTSSSTTEPEIQLREAPSLAYHDERAPPVTTSSTKAAHTGQVLPAGEPTITDESKVGEAPEAAASPSAPQESTEDAPTVAAAEQEIQLTTAPSLLHHEPKMGSEETASPIMVRTTSETVDTVQKLPTTDGAEVDEVRQEAATSAPPSQSTDILQTVAAPSSEEPEPTPPMNAPFLAHEEAAQPRDEEKVGQDAPSAEPIPSTPEHAPASEEETKQSEEYPVAGSSTSEIEGKEKTTPAE